MSSVALNATPPWHQGRFVYVPYALLCLQALSVTTLWGSALASLLLEGHWPVGSSPDPGLFFNETIYIGIFVIAALAFFSPCFVLVWFGFVSAIERSLMRWRMVACVLLGWVAWCLMIWFDPGAVVVWFMD